ncbi:MAG: alpha/beta fold hydrolase [Phycisphaerales bacterium]|nr:alpha/beta fold hydrolase [Phycisphaerales bacterium]
MFTSAWSYLVGFAAGVVMMFTGDPAAPAPPAPAPAPGLAAAPEVQQDFGGLPRRAWLGAALETGSAGGVIVRRVIPGGTAERSELRVGDRILEINGGAIGDVPDLLALLKRLPAGPGASARVARGEATVEVPLTVVSTPREAPTDDTYTISYSVARRSDGTRLRTIITVPVKDTGRRPAVLFIQGITCSSVDHGPNLPGPDVAVVQGLAARGFVTMRVDKPGVGDSEGRPCADMDFDTELDGYLAAMEALRAHPRVNPDRVFIFGHSMGGVMAPYVAAKFPVRGIAAFGTTARTWMEYTLENSRRQLGLVGVPADQINEEMGKIARFHALVLLDGLTPGEAWQKFPELEARGPGSDELRMSGRHVKFFQQLQARNPAAAWSAFNGDALLVHGEYDWVSSEADHREIVALLDSRRPDAARFLSADGLDHAMTAHSTLSASLQGMGGGVRDDRLIAPLAKWIEEISLVDAPARADGAEGP